MMQGCSGGLVFTGYGMVAGPGRKTNIGLAHGTAFDSTGGKYGIIIPSYYIIELFRKVNL